VHFAAKRELARAFPLRRLLRSFGVYFVERADAAQGVEDTREIAAAVARGETVGFFPEGTFTRAPGLADFRLGAFVVSAEAGVALVPIVLRGTRSLLRDQRWLPLRHPVSVSVLPAVMPDGRDWAAAVKLRDEVRATILRHCGEPDLGH
jgi:1-acyl-sn-glycerol-3-phosphate acyltransferase